MAFRINFITFIFIYLGFNTFATLAEVASNKGRMRGNLVRPSAEVVQFTFGGRSSTLPLILTDITKVQQKVDTPKKNPKNMQCKTLFILNLNSTAPSSTKESTKCIDDNLYNGFPSLFHVLFAIS